MQIPVYLMSPPRADWTLKGKANFRSASGQATDAGQARREWASLADAIVEAGAQVLVCPPHPSQALTGLIYTAEAGELAWRSATGQALEAPTFLLPRMAAAHRQAEAPWIEAFIRAALGWRVEQPTTQAWEAQGDALRACQGQLVVHTYGRGPAARTEASAYAQVASRLSERHLQVRFVADPWFHGNTFLGIYGVGADQLALVCEEALEPSQRDALRQALHAQGVGWRAISREQSLGYDTNSLQVGQRVLASETISRPSRQALETLGLEVRTLALSELFLKGGGAPVCLTNRLWGADALTLPQAHLWSAHPDLAHHEAQGLALQGPEQIARPEGSV